MVNGVSCGSLFGSPEAPLQAMAQGTQWTQWLRYQRLCIRYLSEATLPPRIMEYEQVPDLTEYWGAHRVATCDAPVCQSLIVLRLLSGSGIARLLSILLRRVMLLVRRMIMHYLVGHR